MKNTQKKPCSRCKEVLFTMQSSLVHDAKKPCLQRRQIFTGFTYYRFIISQPKPLQTTAPIQFAKIQLFTTRLQVFRPQFCNPPCPYALDVLRVYFHHEVHPTSNSIIHSYTTQNNITSCKRCTYVLFFMKNLFS